MGEVGAGGGVLGVGRAGLGVRGVVLGVGRQVWGGCPMHGGGRLSHGPHLTW